jgi:hypothetical protein
MGIPMSTIRRWAREETLSQGEHFTLGYLPEMSPRSLSYEVSQASSPLIVSGHQPELFHPGVWYKNFLLSELAKRHSSIGINISIDHDLARKFSMSVPTITSDGLLLKESISIDEDRPVWPWEVSRVRDIAKWRSFSSMVIARLNAAGVDHPLLSELWPNVIEGLELGRPLGEALSIARHRIEHSSGLQTIELPFSRLTSERSFACFVGELLTRMESVHATYNAERLAYRRYHKIKNHLQPLPALARDGQWLESPFWVYSTTDPVRRALWVMREGTPLRLSDRKGWQVEFPGERDFEEWYRRWNELKASGISIRPRALTTTAFLRLAVADLFIHGIGGGKYDQMTDKIVRALWDLVPPKYLVATATLHLPVRTSESQEFADSESESEVWERIRDWHFSPERLFQEAETTPARRALILEKNALLARKPTRSEKPGWHQEVQQLNIRIRRQLDETERSLQESLRMAQNRGREHLIRTSREFSFSLFPSNGIIGRLRDLCSDGAKSDNPLGPAPTR